MLDSIPTPLVRPRLLGAITLACTLLVPAAVQAAEPDWFKSIRPFVEAHCLDCHDTATKKGGLDLSALGADLSDAQTLNRWGSVHDRVRAGEMPPRGREQPEPAQSRAATDALAEALTQADLKRIAKTGRTVHRRLNRVEYENSLRDLLALPHLEVKELLPPDAEVQGFDTVGAALAVSDVQIAKYLEASRAALLEAAALRKPVEKTTFRLNAAENGRFKTDKSGSATIHDGSALVFRQPSIAQTQWHLSKFVGPATGTYRVRVSAYSAQFDRGRILAPDREAVLMLFGKHGPVATFDLPATRGKTLEVTTLIRAGDTLDFWSPTISSRGGIGRDVKLTESKYIGPVLIIDWIEIEGPLESKFPPESYRRLFGNLATEELPPPDKVKDADQAALKLRLELTKRPRLTVKSGSAPADAERLLREFMSRAFRRPPPESEVRRYLALVLAEMKGGAAFAEAMLVGYQGVLCSPDYLFLSEQPGRLDDYALAARLSYFLWRSTPDDALLDLARTGEIRKPDVLRKQTERLLNDPRAERFVSDFVGLWLELRKIDFTQPDRKLYPDYDQHLHASIVRETEAYFAEMLRGDLGASHVVASDFAMINARLADLYGIAGVKGDAIRKVTVPKGNPRGGFLTHASVLKVTANGSTTSPVTRGAWVSDRILGQPIPPPPPSAGSIDPDVRGTTTIREQLAKHRSHASCASCHAKMDPPGFALESFDVMGGWREKYRVSEEGEEVKTLAAGRPVVLQFGPVVDPSGETAGERFKGFVEFRQLLLKQETHIARNLASRLLVFSTGATPGFSDRAALEAMLRQAAPTKYGLRTLIHAVVQSPTFQHK